MRAVPIPLSAPILAPEELRHRLENPELATPPIRLLDARGGAAGRRAYHEQHLAGALHADLDADLAAPAPDPAAGGRHPLPSLDTWCRTLGRWGITPDHHIVAYDDQGGANAAARLWWMLRAIDHHRVSVLDGGWAEALSAKVPTETQEPSIAAVAPYPHQDTRWLLPTVGLAELDRARQDPESRVIDVRSRERYRGESDPFDPVAGHIPGALNLPFITNLDASGRFLAIEDLRALYAPLAELPSGRVSVHCGSGVTACHTVLAMDAAGLPIPNLYIGSWSEWCRSDRPRDPSSDDDG